ncbi:MAG: sigma-70 family RNA polymerase sigma factor [Planctomycetota bacterium]|jgi:RNA polymerase sigma-70 factor (ECF subfamily)|nr:sigma-70 family RNA polymerase sigma factor [Planctomycetota bacterium]
MPSNSETDQILIERIRSKDGDAWEDLIGRYEGRLLAFVESRLSNRSASQDIVQEAFIGFLTSLPNYDGNRSLEGYLFSICAHKLTDFLRREGRRPSVPFSAGLNDSKSEWQIAGSVPAASSIARSGERKSIEENALLTALEEQIGRWQEKGDWSKLKCIELLVVRGWTNKKVAEALSLTEQQVANFKFDFVSRMRVMVKRQGLPQAIFPNI